MEWGWRQKRVTRDGGSGTGIIFVVMMFQQRWQCWKIWWQHLCKYGYSSDSGYSGDIGYNGYIDIHKKDSGVIVYLHYVSGLWYGER